MTRLHHHAGFSLIEVLAATGLLGVLTAAGFALSAQAFTGARLADGYAVDLMSSRAALDRLQDDLRASTHAEAIAGGIDLERDGRSISWRYHGTLLTRCADEQVQVLSRAVAAFSATHCDGLWILRMQLATRSPGAAGRPAVITTAVRPRAGAAP